MKNKLSRRDFLKLGGAGLATAAGATAVLAQAQTGPHSKTDHQSHLIQPPMQMDHGQGLPGVGDVNYEQNGFNPGEVLYDFDYGTISTLPNGQTLHEYEIVVFNKNIEVVPGIE